MSIYVLLPKRPQRFPALAVVYTVFPEEAGNIVRIERQIGPLFCRHYHLDASSERIAKLNKTTWPFTREVYNGDRGEVQVLKDGNVEKRLFRGVSPNLNVRESSFFDYRVNDISKRTLPRVRTQ